MLKCCWFFYCFGVRRGQHVEVMFVFPLFGSQGWSTCWNYVCFSFAFESRVVEALKFCCSFIVLES